MIRTPAPRTALAALALTAGVLAGLTGVASAATHPAAVTLSGVVTMVPAGSTWAKKPGTTSWVITSPDGSTWATAHPAGSTWAGKKG